MQENKSSKDYTFDGQVKKQSLTNFQCTEKNCKAKFFEASFVQKLDGGYLNKNRSPLKCPTCGSREIEYIPKGGFGSFMSFSAKSMDEKQKLLKERAHKHAQTKTEKEKREYINKNFTGKALT